MTMEIENEEELYFDFVHDILMAEYCPIHVTDDPAVDNSSDLTTIKPRKRRQRRREPHHAARKKYSVNLFPRIVKHDIRRFYPRMFANVCNSSNGSLITSFLSTYCLPTISMIDSMPSVALSAQPDLPETIIGSGLEENILGILMMIELIPDAAFLNIRSQIRQFRHESGRSELDIEAEICGTKLFDLVLNESDDAYNHIGLLSHKQHKEQGTKSSSRKEALQTEPVLHQAHAYLDATRYLPQTGRQSELTDPSLSSLASTSSSSSTLHTAGVTLSDVTTNSMHHGSMPCTYMPGMRKIVSPAPFSFSVRCFMRISLDVQHRMAHIATCYPPTNP